MLDYSLGLLGCKPDDKDGVSSENVKLLKEFCDSICVGSFEKEEVPFFEGEASFGLLFPLGIAEGGIVWRDISLCFLWFF